MKITALVPSAGAGTRFGGRLPKQFVRLGDRPILAHTLAVLDAAAEIDEIFLMVSPGQEERSRSECIEPFGFKKVVRIVPGGPERQDSVENGLRLVDEDSDIVLVHDGARPFVTPEMIREVLEAAREFGAAMIAVPVRDTVKSVTSDGFVSETVDRRSLCLAQTPQAFSRRILSEAHARARRDGFSGTDDAALVERIGHRVKIVSGSWENFKITRPEDLRIAEGILIRRTGGRGG